MSSWCVCVCVHAVAHQRHAGGSAPRSHRPRVGHVLATCRPRVGRLPISCHANLDVSHATTATHARVSFVVCQFSDALFPDHNFDDFIRKAKPHKGSVSQSLQVADGTGGAAEDAASVAAAGQREGAMAPSASGLKARMSDARASVLGAIPEASVVSGSGSGSGVGLTQAEVLATARQAAGEAVQMAMAEMSGLFEGALAETHSALRATNLRLEALDAKLAEMQAQRAQRAQTRTRAAASRQRHGAVREGPPREGPLRQRRGSGEQWADAAGGTEEAAVKSPPVRSNRASRAVSGGTNGIASNGTQASWCGCGNCGADSGLAA